METLTREDLLLNWVEHQSQAANAVATLVCDYGEWWSPPSTPVEVRPEQQGQCFLEAWKLVTSSPSLRYVEGYVEVGWIEDATLTPFLPVSPRIHAWAVNQDHAVVDVTTPTSQHLLYVGIPFSDRAIRRLGGPSVLGRLSVGALSPRAIRRALGSTRN